MDTPSPEIDVFFVVLFVCVVGCSLDSVGATLDEYSTCDVVSGFVEIFVSDENIGSITTFFFHLFY